MNPSLFKEVDAWEHNPLLSCKWQLLVLKQPPNTSYLRINTMLLGAPYHGGNRVMTPLKNEEYLLANEMLRKYTMNVRNIYGSLGVVECYAQLAMYRRNHGTFVNQIMKETSDLNTFMAKAVHNFIREGDDFYFGMMRDSVLHMKGSESLTSMELDLLVDKSLVSVYQDFEMTMHFPQLVEGVNRLRAESRYDDRTMLQKLESDEYSLLRTNLYKFSANMYLTNKELFVMNEHNLVLLPQLMAELHGKLVEVVSKKESVWFLPFVARPTLNRYIERQHHETEPERKYLTLNALRRFPSGRNVLVTSTYTMKLTEKESEQYEMYGEKECIVHFLMPVDLCATYRYLHGPLVTAESEEENKANEYRNWRMELMEFRKKHNLPGPSDELKDEDSEDKQYETQICRKDLLNYVKKNQMVTALWFDMESDEDDKDIGNDNEMNKKQRFNDE